MTGNRALVLHLMDASLQNFSLVKCISIPSQATHIVDRMSFPWWPTPLAFKDRLITKDGRHINISAHQMPILHIVHFEFTGNIIISHQLTCRFTITPRCAWTCTHKSMCKYLLRKRSNWPHLHLLKSFSDWCQSPFFPAQYHLLMEAGRLIIWAARPVNSLTMEPSRCLALCWGIEQLNSTLEDQRRLQMHLVTCQGLPPHTIWPVLFPLSGRRTSAGSSDGR